MVACEAAQAISCLPYSGRLAALLAAGCHWIGQAGSLVGSYLHSARGGESRGGRPEVPSSSRLALQPGTQGGHAGNDPGSADEPPQQLALW